MASLDGLHVVDLYRNVAGPPAATLLGKIGAEVVEVERPPLGDDARFADKPGARWPPGGAARADRGAGGRVARRGGERLSVPTLADDLWEVNRHFQRLGWSDGLPIVPPTRERVARLLAGSGRQATDVLGRMPPMWGELSLERIAANAVMAGCRPEDMPVVLAAVEALLDDRFNLHGVQCTTHVTGPLLVVNGPVRGRLGLNGANNCFGQGSPANATIGRAVRLVMVNIGGARPGDIDRATFGHPGKYTYCIAENEEDSPWPPFHVEAGFDPGESTVTAFAAEAPHNVNNHTYDPYRLLDAIAGTIATPGANNFYVMGDYTVVLGVDHARILDQAGWKRRHVQRYLFERARLPVPALRSGGMYPDQVERNLWPRWIERGDPDATVPPVREPEDLKIFVAGGAGPHSLVIPGWGTRAVTRSIVATGGAA